ncbi:MAG: HEAT repeat domain-containing protein [Rivularia sp. (in: cyanobacteria)]
MVETVKQQQEDKTERLTVIEGLRKYAANHVLLIGRPGSGKSTAFIRLLLEKAQNQIHLEINFQANSESRLKTTKSSATSQFQLTSAMSQGIDSLVDLGENEQIPILVELRFYKTSIIDLIRDFLLRHNLPIDSGDVKFNVSTLLRQGQFLLLIDGINELPSEAARQDLQKFRQDYRNTTPMIFTTRDLGIGGDLGIEKKLQMQPLTENQMRDFVCGYLPQGEELLKQLEGRLRELGETPLLLMMLCSVFASNQNKVPANLGLVFRRFTEIYDKKLKQDIPVTDESRRWWKRLLQHLAWVMMHGGSKTGELKTEILVTIPIQEARDILTKFLKEQDYHQPRDAEKWLDDLLKHHLIQLGAENQIQFRHQLLQEYYAAERLLEELPKLSDDELQWEYLNYLKWTEVVTLMMQLVDNQSQAVSLVKLALEVDWLLGARLAGEVKEEWQGETVKLITDLNLPKLLEVRLLGITKSEATVNILIERVKEGVRYAIDALREIPSINSVLLRLIQNQNTLIRSRAVYAMGRIINFSTVSTLTPILIKALNDKDASVRSSAASALYENDSNEAILSLIKALDDQDASVRSSAASALWGTDSDEAIVSLIKALDDQDASVRIAAVRALEENASDQAISGLIQGLDNQNYQVINCAVSALESIAYKPSMDVLIKCLKNKCGLVRDYALSILQEINDDDVYVTLDALQEAIVDTDDVKVKEALREIYKQISEEFEFEQAAIKWGIDNYTNNVSESNTIEHSKSDIRASTITEIIQDLKSENCYVMCNALEALKLIDDEAAIPLLIKALKDNNFVEADNGNIFSSALQTLKKLQNICKYYKPIPKLMMSNTSHNYALLIGVGECEETKLSLPVTVKDIQALKSLLTDSNLCGYIDNNIRLLYNETATKEKILENLTWLKQQAENDPEATILIYYSGHGCLDNSGNYYLIPHETDRADIPDTALSAETINQALQAIPAQRLLVIIDSCHAQGMATSKDDAGKNQRSAIPKGFTQTALPKTIIDDLKGAGRVVFTSSTGTQSSWIRSDDTMSIYTYHFLEALQGAGNQPGDKTVKVSHLMNYLSKTVPITVQKEYNKEQTPFFDFATEDFPVALLRGGKGLPEAGYESVKAETQEKIRNISNQVKDGVGIVGDRNSVINVVGGNNTFGNITK